MFTAFTGVPQPPNYRWDPGPASLIDDPISPFDREAQQLAAEEAKRRNEVLLWNEAARADHEQAVRDWIGGLSSQDHEAVATMLLARAYLATQQAQPRRADNDREKGLLQVYLSLASTHLQMAGLR